MKIIEKLIGRKRGAAIFFFLLVTLIIFLTSYFTMLNGWSVDTAEYKLIVRTKGHLNNLTVTNWIYYFNASTANLTLPEGINIETRAYSTNNNSIVEIVFEDFKDELAVIVLSNIEPLSNIPISSIPIDESAKKFSGWRPAIEGDLENCTNFFSYLSISANTQRGRINLYSYSVEAIVTDGELKWSNWSQSKERTLTLSLWAFIFLSATISSICVTTISLLLSRRVLQIFPIVTLLLASIMCFIYLYVGVGNDFLSIADADFGSRLSLSLLSGLFHTSYNHLIGNLLGGFIIGGSLIEIWLLKFRSMNRYLWYFSPVPLAILIDVSNLFLYPSISPSVGSSLWSIGIAIVLVLSIFQERSRLSRLTSVWDLVALLLCGYLAISSTWNYLASLLIHYYSNAMVSLSANHLMFVVLYSFVICIILWIGSRKETPK